MLKNVFINHRKRHLLYQNPIRFGLLKNENYLMPRKINFQYELTNFFSQSNLLRR